MTKEELVGFLEDLPEKTKVYISVDGEINHEVDAIIADENKIVLLP